MITIGIDPHKSSLTAVALDATGHEPRARRFPVNAGTQRALLSWANRLAPPTAAEHVLDVPVGCQKSGPGSLTSRDRWSDMIPACRCG